VAAWCPLIKREYNLLKAKRNLKLWVGLAIVAAILMPLLVMLGQRMEGSKPKVQLDPSSLAVGVTHELSGTVSDDDSGIRKVWIGLYKDGKESVLFEKVYAGSVFWGKSETRQADFKVTISPEKLGLTDGDALLRIVARDYSWRGWFNGNRTYIEKGVSIDTRPPPDRDSHRGPQCQPGRQRPGYLQAV